MDFDSNSLVQLLVFAGVAYFIYTKVIKKDK